MNSTSLIVIGGGPGGYAVAQEASQKGLKVTIIEEDRMGGTCLNRGCIPSKFLLSKAKHVAAANALPSSGVQVHLEKLRMRQMIEQKDAVLNTLRQRNEQGLKSARIEHLQGRARLISSREVEFQARHQLAQRLNADAIVLATGSTPLMPKVFPSHQAILNSTTILDLSHLPTHLVVIGGGYIGCELACAFHGLGSKVTLIEKENRLFATQPEFETAATILQRSFQKRGMTLWTGVTVQNVQPLDDQHLRITCSNNETFEANAILLALGRTPNTMDIGLEAIGIDLTKGRLTVDVNMQTSIPGVYAIRDVYPVPLAHTAVEEARAVVAHLVGQSRSVFYPMMPRCIYTWPEAAAVGYTEASARDAGYTTRVDRYHMAANSKAMAEEETEGLWVLVSDVKTGKILGAQIVGLQATELIHLVALAIKAKLTVQDVAETVFAHPTLAEGFGEAAARSLAAIKKLPTSFS